MSIPIGAQLGSYEITGLLGKGGMGEVYRARDAKLKREVAIKILPEEFSRDSDRVMRFQREAEVLASLNHPNIAAIYDLQEAGGVRFFVLELVEGETLGGRMARGAIPVDETLAIAKGICEALEAAHEKAIAHRDLKPANIKITPEGRVKVLDFGLAKIFAPDASDGSLSHSPTLLSVSAQGVILGTPSYMSPEQARGQNVDAQSDVWAFGCILYEMLTGQRAFAGDTITDILGGVVRIDPDWAGLPSDTPPLLRLLVRQCLQKPRAARLHHIGDARIQIEASSVEIASAAAASTTPAETKRRLPFVWIAATGILAAIVAVMTPFAIRYLREAPADPTTAVRFTIPPPEKATFPDALASPFPTVSHNGRMAAIIAGSEGIQRIWIRNLDSLEARPLAGTEGVGQTFPFWSPDDRFIAFVAQGKLKKVDVAGGPPQIICETTQVTKDTPLNGSWNRDGVIIFNQTVIMRVAASGGNAEPVTTLDETRREKWHLGPEFLPDGNHFLFLSGGGSTDAIMVGSMNSKETKLILNANSFAKYDSGHLFFVREGALIAQSFDTSKLQVTGDAITLAEQIRQNPNNGQTAFWASGNGTLIYRNGGNAINRKLQWFDRTGRPLGSVGPRGAYRNPELSPDGKRIAVERTDAQTRNGDIWLLDVATGVPTRWTFDPGLDMFPVWSPTGEQIVFGTSRNGMDNLYLKSSTGGAEELLLKGAAIPRDWSRDNRFLVYGVAAGTQLMVLPLSGDRKPFPFLPNANFGYAQSRISPDGKWLAYYSNESGRSEIYVQNFPVPSAKYQISNGGGISPRWRRDGKEMFYVAPDNKLMAVPLRITEKSVEALFAPSTLFDIGAPPVPVGYGVRQQYDVTADGQRFIVNTSAEQTAETPVTVIWNWPATIKH